MPDRSVGQPEYWRAFFESRAVEARRQGLANAEAYLREHLDDLVAWAVEGDSGEPDTGRSPFVYVMW